MTRSALSELPEDDEEDGNVQLLDELDCSDELELDKTTELVELDEELPTADELDDGAAEELD